MDLLAKTGQVLMIVILIYLWNKYIVTKVIQGMVKFYKRNVVLDKNLAIKFFIKNDNNFINFGKYFYWFGGAIICLQNLFI